MEEFRCEICDYKTKDKSNYKRHKKSQKHRKKVIDANTIPKNPISSQKILFHPEKIPNNKEEEKNECKFCHKKFTQRCHLKRHNKICKIRIKTERKEENKIGYLEKEIREKNKEIEKQKSMITEAEKIVMKTININDRITKYLEMNYSNVPALLPPTNEQIEEVIEIENKEEEFCFGKYFIVNIDELVKIIGKIIIGIYKNEENIFSTDISRLSFYIRAKELIKKNKEEMVRWIKDPKGIKLKEVIIEPIIKYMMDEIRSYFNKIKMKDVKSIEMMTKKNEELKKITDIMVKDKEELANDIVKNIAPIFKLK